MNLEEIRISVDLEFQKGLIELFEELRVIYRFEGNELVMYKPEAEAFLNFLKPINEFYEQLEKAINE